MSSRDEIKDALDTLVSATEAWEQACSEVADAISELQGAEGMQEVMGHDDWTQDASDTLDWIGVNDPDLSPAQEMLSEAESLQTLVHQICDDLDEEEEAA